MPTTSLAWALYREIQKGLPQVSRNSLHLYDCLGYSLDTDYGADGFFEWCDRIVFFDLTLQRQKVNFESRTIVIGRDNLTFHLDTVTLGSVIAKRLIESKPYSSLPKDRHAYLPS